MENAIAKITMAKLKLDFRKNVISVEGNLIKVQSDNGSIQNIRCYVAKYNPASKLVEVKISGDEDYSVLYFPQKSNNNVILVPRLQTSSFNISEITSSIISKWAYE
tara:strand:+ start:958 stop:1275 length:318 start_codon:yes stop_codon:yes gene_type:complete